MRIVRILSHMGYVRIYLVSCEEVSRLHSKPSLSFAEREGFEPPVRLRTSVFKTDAIDHSAIFPRVRQQARNSQYRFAKLTGDRCFFSKKPAKVQLFFGIRK